MSKHVKLPAPNLQQLFNAIRGGDISSTAGGRGVSMVPANPIMQPANNTPLVTNGQFPPPKGYSQANTFEPHRPFNATAYRHSLKGQTTAELHRKLDFHEKKLHAELAKKHPDKSLVELERKEIRVLRGVIDGREHAAAQRHRHGGGGGGGVGGESGSDGATGPAGGSGKIVVGGGSD